METTLLSDYITAVDPLYDMMTSHYTTSPSDHGYGSMTSDDTNSLHGDSSLSPLSAPDACHGFTSEAFTLPAYQYQESSYLTAGQYPTMYANYQDRDFMNTDGAYNMFSSSTGNFVSTTPAATDCFLDQPPQYQPHFSPLDQLYFPFAAQTNQSDFSMAATKPKRKRVQNSCQRKAANVRERKRMCSVNSAFDVLKKRVPTFSYEKRLSRIETLKLAIDYIAFMTDVLNGQNPDNIPMSRYASVAKKFKVDFSEDV